MTEQSIGQLAIPLVDRWTWWQNALKGEFGSIHDGDPQQGYYRVRPKGGQWEPVAIYYPDDSDQIVAYRNGREIAADDIWTWCCRNPITFEAYEKAMAGGGFDDEPAPVRGVGDNSGEVDPFDALRIEYLGEVEQIAEFMKKPVKTQAEADKLAVWKDRLSRIKSRAVALHKVEKAPHLEAGRQVDNKWRELKEEPDTYIEKVRLHVKPFFEELRRAEEERQRKAREAAAEAQRRADEAAAKANQTDDNQDAVQREAAKQAAEEAAAQARQAEKDAAARKVTVGRTGARMGYRKQTVGKITDYKAFTAALVDIEHKDFMEFADTLANRAAKAGMKLDGMEIREEEVIR
jgi:hypothetical protein